MVRRLRHAILAVAIGIGLWLTLLLCLEFGRRVGIAHVSRWGMTSRSGVEAVDGAIYGLLSLLIGFMFGGAAGRFDRRRQLVADEANAIGTAWQRLDLLPPDQQRGLRPLFREYLDALIAFYTTDTADPDPVRQPTAVTRAQDAVWARAVSSCLTPPGEPARMLLLPSLNEMFGTVERERTTRLIHPPVLIFVMLIVTELAAALFAGYTLSGTPVRNWFYIIGIATAIAFATYVILELEYPRLGWVRIDAMDCELVELRQSMGEDAGTSAPAIRIANRRSG